MAANACTSTTGTVTGTDPNFVVTYKTNNPEGLILYVKYTKGTEASISITFDTVNPSLHATDKYRHVSISGTTLSAYTMTISSTGNYRIPMPLIGSEKQLIANVVFATAGQGGAVVANFCES
ncbi:MAG: hypothetical protein WC332_00565 [Clostridia bacterium]|jgi:hypothetical protein